MGITGLGLPMMQELGGTGWRRRRCRGSVGGQAPTRGSASPTPGSTVRAERVARPGTGCPGARSSRRASGRTSGRRVGRVPEIGRDGCSDTSGPSERRRSGRSRTPVPAAPMRRSHFTLVGRKDPGGVENTPLKPS